LNFGFTRKTKDESFAREGRTSYTVSGTASSRVWSAGVLTGHGTQREASRFFGIRRK